MDWSAAVSFQEVRLMVYRLETIESQFIVFISVIYFDHFFIKNNKEENPLAYQNMICLFLDQGRLVSSPTYC